MNSMRQLIGLAAFLALGGCKSWLFDKQPDENNSTVAITSAHKWRCHADD